MATTIERKITTDMWCYELPLLELTEADCMHANQCNIAWQHNYLEECDYLFGTWNSLVLYLKDYIGCDIDANYMRPMITNVKEEVSRVVKG